MQIIPSFLVDKGFFLPLRLSCKESSTFSPSPSSSGSGDVTALRCSEPLRYKVDGASKPSPNCAGWDRLGITCYNLLELADWGCMGGGLLVETTIFVPHRSIALRLSPLEWGYFLTFCLLQARNKIICSMFCYNIDRKPTLS